MNNENNQLARIIYHQWLSSMKYTLDLEELAYRDKGRHDPRYKTFKKHIMSHTYNSLRTLFQSLEDLGLIRKTDYPEDVHDGYKETVSGGSGYINTEEFDEWLNYPVEDDTEEQT